MGLPGALLGDVDSVTGFAGFRLAKVRTLERTYGQCVRGNDKVSAIEQDRADTARL